MFHFDINLGKAEYTALKSVCFDFAAQKISIKVSIFTHFQYFRYHSTPPEVVFSYVTPEALRRRNKHLAEFIKESTGILQTKGM